MADFDYTQSSKERKKKYKPKKELRGIMKEHNGPENKKTFNKKFADLGKQGIHEAMHEITPELYKSVQDHLKKNKPYPGGLGPDADEGSPDTGPWDEDWN